MKLKKKITNCLAVAVLGLSALPAFGIVGGSNVASGWYTYSAVILDGSGNFICTGTLVASRWVMTAKASIGPESVRSLLIAVSSPPMRSSRTRKSII